MTIKQAEEKWDEKLKNIFEYIANGWIKDISINDNQIIIPDMPKPYKIKSNPKRTASNIYKYILLACDSGEYIDSNFMSKLNVTPGEFKLCINELLDKKIIRKNEDYKNDYSNIGFTLTLDGIDIAKNYTSSPTKLINKLSKFNISLNVITQIGIVNKKSK